jgi:hypothetical protein
MSAHLLGMAFAADMGTCVRKLVLLKLVDHCHDDGTRIFPAMTTVAKAAQCSVRTVQREMKLFVEAGLLSLVQEGGKGKGSTNEYALDLKALRVISDVGWDAWRAGEDASRSQTSKGDTVSPLNPDDLRVTDATVRVTPATSKGDTRCHTTPQEPLEPSKARVGARTPGGEREVEPVGSRSSVGDDRPPFANFKRKWPNKAVDDMAKAQAEYDKLGSADRQAAIDGIVPYREALKAAGRSKLHAAANYLKQRKWEDLETDPDPSMPYLPPHVPAFGALWSAAMIEMLRTGAFAHKRFVFKQLCAGAPNLTLAFGSKRDGELVSLAERFTKAQASSETGRAFVGWLEAQFARARITHQMPRFREDFWLYVPPPDTAASWGIPLVPGSQPDEPRPTMTDDEAAKAF